MAHKSHLSLSTLFIDENNESKIKVIKGSFGQKLMSCSTGTANRNNPYQSSLEIEDWNTFAKTPVEYRCKKCNKVYDRKLAELRATRAKHAVKVYLL